ncbi:hypothetical protein FAIPA1_10463 [Frankia sp. AiPs1]|uniref:SRPBCC family protein n=1 Tax=Frankia sp. AiPa1 TaxID=573492 RepID=UPI00202AF83A|nr:SRPBCC family protein [Frankia sp. AiPa1]MCL9758160.1 hypothetical protein [Frankia sp. AiPa1]
MLDRPISWKLALDTCCESYHFSALHHGTFGQLALTNCALFAAFGPCRRLVILDVRTGRG